MHNSKQPFLKFIGCWIAVAGILITFSACTEEEMSPIDQPELQAVESEIKGEVSTHPDLE